jgi:hypothetical protein
MTLSAADRRVCQQLQELLAKFCQQHHSSSVQSAQVVAGRSDVNGVPSGDLAQFPDRAKKWEALVLVRAHF